MWINLDKNIHNKYQQHFKKQLLYLKNKTNLKIGYSFSILKNNHTIVNQIKFKLPFSFSMFL